MYKALVKNEVNKPINFFKIDRNGEYNLQEFAYFFMRLMESRDNLS